MAVFKSSEQLQQVLGGFFKLLASDPTVGPKLLASKLVLKFIYKDPELSITIDLKSAEEALFTFNDADKKADVEMTMKADVAHKFWLGQLNLVVALARREIVAKGPVPKILQMLPIIKPAYKLYPDYIKATDIAS